MPQEPQARQGQPFLISYESERDIFIARNTLGGVVVEKNRDFNALYTKCEEQGMIFDGISEES